MIRRIRWRLYRIAKYFGYEWWNIRPRISTPNRTVRFLDGVLPGGFAKDINSELYVRADKDHPGREFEWSYNRLEKLINSGAIGPKGKPYRPIDDRERRMYRDRMDYYNRKYGEAP